jgi:hypothetical protein
MDIKILKERLEKAREKYDLKMKEAFSKDLPSWGEFEDFIEHEGREMEEASRVYRMHKEPKYVNSVPDYGDVMSLASFIENVKSGGFIDYDGSGEYIKDGMMSGITINPSDVKYGSIRKDFDTIVWFNR